MTRAELLQIAKPILFNTDMTVAILEDRKTVTRRLIKPQLSAECPSCKYVHNEYMYDVTARNIYCARCGELLKPEKRAPYHPGDVLYVRETWKKAPNGYFYYEDWQKGDIADVTKWHPSIHMPKKAARIFLKVKDVRVERLQDIIEEQAQKEGIHYDECPSGFTWKQNTSMTDCYTSARGAFGALWNSTIKKSDLARYGWDANPWVWKIEFERIEPQSEGE